MTDTVLCLDSSVLVKFLVPEMPLAQDEEARRLVLRGITAGRLVAPTCAWLEVGSVLRKKVRQGILASDLATVLWERFGLLAIDYLDFPELRARSYQLAESFGLATLYDAAFLACTELAPVDEPADREFWTADVELVRMLGDRRPEYVHLLGE